jgi:quinohemoprotein ethanol dehydrogenase
MPLRHPVRSVLLFAATLLLAACNRQVSAPPAMTEWMRETAHYSLGRQIDAGNVDKLGVAWEFADFVRRGRTNRGVEATPVFHDGLLYMVGPWNVVYALDAKTGQEKWRYDPEVAGEYGRRTCCDVVSRGVAVEDGRVYVATLDGYLIALDSKTGKPLWKSDTFTDRSRSLAITGAPRIAGKVVVIGNGGGEMGVRGYASGFDKQTGKLAWRFFVVPGDPKAGPDESPEVTEARKTWDPKSTWDLGGGGGPWDSIVYDPDTNIVFVGTGNGSPHPGWSRSPSGGDNLYLSSIVALDADTGRKKWHYQTTPHDSWDYTATQNMILADLDVGGRQRKVILQAPKNGFFYMLDRVTGELLSAEKFTTVTWADRVDLKTGRPVLNPQGDYSKGIKLIWPSESGGHNWPPMSYSETTGLVYIPLHESGETFQRTPMPYKPYSIVQGSTSTIPALMGPNDTAPAILKGQPKPNFNDRLLAWDPVKAKAVWTSEALPYWSGGTATTAGGLVFMGSADGFLAVYDGRTGKVLRRIQTGTGIMASPLAYEIDGTQYVAVAAGFGGAFGGYFAKDTAAARWENKARLIVFKLDGKPVTLPAPRVEAPESPAPAKYRGTAAQVANGARLFDYHCARCHSDASGAGNYPNLWRLPPATHEAFEAIVLKGIFADAGMASFADVVSPKDARDIHAYLAEPRKPPPASPQIH